MSRAQMVRNHCLAILQAVAENETVNGYPKRLSYLQISRLSGVPDTTIGMLVREHLDMKDHSRLSLIATQFGYAFKVFPDGPVKISAVKISGFSPI